MEGYEEIKLTSITRTLLALRPRIMYNYIFLSIPFLTSIIFIFVLLLPNLKHGRTLLIKVNLLCLLCRLISLLYTSRRADAPSSRTNVSVRRRPHSPTTPPLRSTHSQHFPNACTYRTYCPRNNCYRQQQNGCERRKDIPLNLSRILGCEEAWLLLVLVFFLGLGCII